MQENLCQKGVRASAERTAVTKSSFLSTACVAFGLALAMPTPLVAHHGVTGQFDLSQTYTITGIVNRVRFVNPHSYIYFEVANDAGEKEQWRCELRSGSLLRRKGWSKDMFPIGTEITVFGSPDRRDPTTCYAETITFSDGTTLNRYDAMDEDGKVVVAERARLREDGTPNIEGNWSMPERDGPPSGPPPAPYAISPAGLAAIEGVDEDLVNPRRNCQATNIILDWWFDQMVNEIKQTESEIVLSYGFMDMVRTIHLVGDMPEDFTPSRTGYSVGVWDDDTLVVETTGFIPGYISGGGRAGLVMHTEEMSITERFTLNEDGTEIVRSYTISDPLFLTEPYNGQDLVRLTTDSFEDYSCDDLTNEKDY